MKRFSRDILADKVKFQWTVKSITLAELSELNGILPEKRSGKISSD
jgi:hypothetical protein